MNEIKIQQVKTLSALIQLNNVHTPVLANGVHIWVYFFCPLLSSITRKFSHVMCHFRFIIASHIHAISLKFEPPTRTLFSFLQHL